jgi:hypothetical protein
LSIDGIKTGQYVQTEVFDDAELDVSVAERSDEMVRNNVPNTINWNVTDTFSDWFEHVGETLTMTVDGNNFGAVSGGEIGWNIYGMTLTVGTPTVWVEAEDAEATEGADPADNGQFKFSRSNVGLAYPLSAGYAVSGTATNEVDYEPLDAKVKFAANEATKFVDVVVKDDEEVEWTESVSVVIAEGAGVSTTALIPL